MIKSKIFHSKEYIRLENKIRNFLNSAPDFMTVQSVISPRSVGDAVQNLLADNTDSILGDNIRDYSSSFARRAMADLAFSDRGGCYYVVDVKTHCLDTEFNMPNLISVERLSRFYEDDKNNFIILVCAYTIEKTHLKFQKVHFVPIEFLSWKCLTIGALGWGQIQIANSNKIEIISQNSRKKWMIELCDKLFLFYPSEIIKIGSRIKHFQKVKEYWQKKED